MRNADGRKGRAGARRRPSFDPAAAGGSPVEVVVERLGGRGDAIAQAADGRRLYIPKSLPGERLRVRVGDAQGDGFAADIVVILEPSPERVPPPCPHFDRCGGCALQHLEDGAYLAWKLARLTTALAKAGIGGYDLRPVVRAGPGKRRRATFGAVRGGGSGAPVQVGFAEPRSHAIVDLAACLVLEPRILALLPALRGLLGEILAPGERSRIAVALLDGGLDVVLERPGPPAPAVFERLARFANDADVARLSWRKGAEAITEPLVQRRPVRAVFAGIACAVPPGAFLQASARGEAALTDAVLAATPGSRAVADLFSGVGTFALPLAAAGRRVHAVDADGSAVDALARAARGHPRLEAERRNLFALPLSAEELRRFDAVVFDPPRAGARAQAAALAASAVATVVAVSCNPDSFIRDAKILAAGGYRLASLTPVDQFLWSAHLELAAVFVR